MSLLFRGRPVAMEARSTVRLPSYLANIDLVGGTDAGTYVTEDTAMRHDAVWSCVTKISQDVSMMPVDVVRYQGGERVDVSPTPEIIATPSAFIPALDWRYQVVASWLTAGNAWGLVTKTTPDHRYPLRIELQSPASVTWRPNGSGVQFFVNNQPHDLWPVGDLWHRPAYTAPGALVGLSPIAYHRMTIGKGLAAEKFGGDFFADGGHPNAILSPESDPGPEATARLKARFKELTRGNRDVIVLPQSTKYTPIQVNPEDSQFIEAERYSVEQICRIYGEDPADHGASSGGGSITYANRSDADMARFKRRQFWVTKLQDSLTDMLPRPQVVKLNVSASLMMTARERHELHKLRLDSKTTTINEVRTIEDEKPFPGDEYDEPGIPGETPSAPDSPTDDPTQGGAE